MQVTRNLILPKAGFNNSKLWFLLRSIIVLAVIYYLFQGILSNNELLFSLQRFHLYWGFQNLSLLLIVIALIPINWFFEAKKWQIIAAAENLTLNQAFVGVLMGLSLDNALPFGMGAISGRIATIKTVKKIELVPGILAGQILQSLFTFSFGLVGVYMIWQKSMELYVWKSHMSILILVVVAIALLSFILFRERIIRFLIPLRYYSVNSWLSLSLISLLRYVTFFTQFLLLIYIFAPEFNTILASACITWVFAARTFMPKVSNLERLGIRALAVVFFANIFSFEPAGVLVAVALLWLINLAIPSLVGLYFLMKSKSSK